MTGRNICALLEWAEPQNCTAAPREISSARYIVERDTTNMSEMKKQNKMQSGTAIATHRRSESLVDRAPVPDEVWDVCE